MRKDDLCPRVDGAPTFKAAPAAWEILALLQQRMLPIHEMLETLAGHRPEDLRAAYWLTRRQADLARRQLLVNGEDAGRAARIRARNILARAYRQAVVVDERVRLEAELQDVLARIRRDPPPAQGTHLRSPMQALQLAGAPQPVEVKLRRLVAIRPDGLAAALERLRGLAPDGWLRRGWPSRDERPVMIRVLEVALQLQREGLAARNT